MMYTPPAGSYKFQHRNEMKNPDPGVHVFCEIQCSLLYVCINGDVDCRILPLSTRLTIHIKDFHRCFCSTCQNTVRNISHPFILWPELKKKKVLNE